MNITILSDNVAKAPLLGEHGFAAYIQSAGTKLLFDTGQGLTLLKNAALLNCDLNTLDGLILSHGHYDHTGAIKEILALNPQLPVYYHQGALVDRYSFKQGSVKNIAITEQNRKIISTLSLQQNKQIVKQTPLTGNIFVTGSIPRLHPLEDSGGNFYFNQEQQKKDSVEDEIALWLKSKQGIIVLTGCCHAGIINTCELVKKQSKSDIYAVIGGLHLHSASAQRLAATAEYLNTSSIKKIVMCHCSGIAAVNYLKKQTRLTIEQGSVGYNLFI